MAISLYISSLSLLYLILSGTQTPTDPPSSSASHGLSAATHEVHGFDVLRHSGHQHADLELHCWDSPVQFLLAGRIITLPANRPTIFWAGNPHFLIQSDREALHHISWITLPMAWFGKWNLHPDFLGDLFNGTALHLSEDGNWQQRMQEWVGLIQSGEQGKTIATLEIQALLLRLQSSQTKVAAAYEDLPSERVMPQAVHKALMWMLDHFKEPISTSDVADALGYNNRYLMTAFKQHVGQTVQRYLTQLRVMEAQRLLLQGDLAITQVALAAGFGSLARFFASFRTMCGQSPRSFRKASRLALNE